MGYRRFALLVTVQVLLILGVCLLIAYVALATDYRATLLVLLLALAAQTALLLHYVRRTNRELARFVLSIRDGDFSARFAREDTRGSFAELAAAFDEILQRFRQTRAAREEQAQYLQTLVQHVPVAVLALEADGRISLFNHAARRLLGVTGLRNLHEFVAFGPSFPNTILGLPPGEQQLVKVAQPGGLLQLNLAATELRVEERSYKIVTLQDIHGELEARELEAWQALIRVLTHEIMNSITPILSLADTAEVLLAEARQRPGEFHELDDAEAAIAAISTRCSGLVRFVEAYRRLMRLPQPSIREIQLTVLLERVARLLGPEIERRRAMLEHWVLPPGLKLHADPDLLEQALINLLHNALDAVAERPVRRLTLGAQAHPSGGAELLVRDSGCGMDDELREKIFVPFFTTKPEGSGVGLSLVRQIVRAHRGRVSVETAPGQGTCVRLIL